eukprot:TRINITY_DN10856_c0_g1_i2.p1 TRINITY_DN10856_c0_g1~~TRINITY_DN10856_c0_g1_i2.p1  ORF type:complete len:814 (+),score=138.77 TRINITY_DN10856_c0_g1_i2:68-2509(+)
MCSRSKFVISKRADGCLEKRWDLSAGTELGEGSYAKVSLAHRRGTGVARAVKTIKRSAQARHMTQMEISCLCGCDHQNIVKLFEVLDEGDRIHLVLEHLVGGSLYDYCCLKGAMSELQVTNVAKQVVTAVRLLQDLSITHNDLSAKNLCFLHKGPVQRNVVKVIDFGAATVIPADGQGNQDMWRCGCLLDFLFRGNSDTIVGERTRIGDSMLCSKAWSRVSQAGQRFASMLFKKDATKRVSAATALCHKWFEQPKSPRTSKVCTASAAPTPTPPMLASFVQRLRDFVGFCELKKGVLRTIADQLDEEALQAPLQLLAYFDRNRDGLITPAEVFTGLQFAEVPVPADLSSLMVAADPDCTGTLERTSFVAVAMDRSLFAEENACRRAFFALDTGIKGRLDEKCLMRVLPRNLSAVEMDHFQRTLKGSMDFKEFFQFVGADGKPEAFFTVLKAAVRFGGMLKKEPAPGLAAGGTILSDQMPPQRPWTLVDANKAADDYHRKSGPSAAPPRPASPPPTPPPAPPPTVAAAAAAGVASTKVQSASRKESEKKDSRIQQVRRIAAAVVDSREFAEESLPGTPRCMQPRPPTPPPHERQRLRRQEREQRQSEPSPAGSPRCSRRPSKDTSPSTRGESPQLRRLSVASTARRPSSPTLQGSAAGRREPGTSTTATQKVSRRPSIAPAGSRSASKDSCREEPSRRTPSCARGSTREAMLIAHPSGSWQQVVRNLKLQALMQGSKPELSVSRQATGITDVEDLQEESDDEGASSECGGSSPMGSECSFGDTGAPWQCPLCKAKNAPSKFRCSRCTRGTNPQW